MDRYIQFAAASAIEAIEDSGLQLDELDADRSQSGVQDQAVDRGRMAVTLGSAVGGTMALEDGYVAVSNRGQEWLVDPEYAPPFLYNAIVPSSLASEVALKFGANGPLGASPPAARRASTPSATATS